MAVDGGSLEPVNEFSVIARPCAKGKIFIKVICEYRDSFYAFLLSKGIQCTFPSSAFRRNPQWVTNGNGRRVRDEGGLYQEIMATGSMEDNGRWLSEWVRLGPKKWQSNLKES